MSDLSAPRRSIFAVWRWPRWTWGVVVLLMLGGYVLAPPFIWFFCFSQGRWLNPYLPRGADHVIAAFFMPAQTAGQWWIIGEIHDLEFALLTWLLIPHGD